MGRVAAYYQTVAGELPVRFFLDSLPAQAAKKVSWVIDLLEDLDRVPEIYFSKMPGTDSIWECRATFGSKQYRVFAFMDGQKIVLTHGFTKKTRKTPVREIERAERYRHDYFQRKKGGG